MVNSLNKKPLTEREQEIYNLAYHRGIKKGRAEEKAEHKYLIKEDGSIHNLDEDIENARIKAFEDGNKFGYEKAIEDCCEIAGDYSYTLVEIIKSKLAFSHIQNNKGAKK